MSGQLTAHCSRRHRPLWGSRACTGGLQILFVIACCALAASGQGSNALNGNADSDGQALQSIRIAFGSPPALSSWAAGNPCTSSWTGITCTAVNGAPRVTTMALNGAGLNGTLPDNLIKLTALQILNMSNNAISGSLPNNWAFPDVFTQLQIVTLDHNQLGGSLPGAYSRGLKSLIVLNMDNNNFSGSLPEAWGSPGAFPMLRVLALKNSSLQGGLPPAWGNSSRAMPSLTILTMDSNRLSGSLPATWSQGFPSLSLLTLTGNQINGTLPPAWGQSSALPKLAILALSSNNISGSFPDAWASGSAFPAMRGSGNGMVLQPGNGQLTGAVPLGTPYPVLRYNGATGYSMCSQFPCAPLAAAPGPSVALAPTPATGKGQSVVATLSLQGQGLYPLSPQGRQALLNSVNQTLAAQGTTVTNITLGQVNDLASAAPAPATQIQSAKRRQLLQASQGSQAQVIISTIAGASNQDVQSVANTLQQAVSSGKFADSLRQGGLNVSQVFLGQTSSPGSPAAQAPAPQSPASPPAQPPAQAPTTPAQVPAPSNPASAPAAPPPEASPAPASAAAAGNTAPSSGGGGGSSGIGTGGIIGIVVGIIAALALLGALVGCLALRRRRARRADRKSLKPSPSTPAVPPPTSPVTRQRSMDSNSGGSFTNSVGARPRSQTEAQMERTSSGKTNVIPYSQYRKSRLDSIRNDLGLQGGAAQRDRVNGAGESQPTTPRAGSSGV